MASKKDFAGMNTGRVYGAIEQATSRKGQQGTMTEFANLVIAAYQREHPEILAKAREFLDTVNSGAFSSLLDGGNSTENE